MQPDDLPGRHTGVYLVISSKQVGARLPKLVEETDELDVEKWGRTRSTTWKVKAANLSGSY